MILEALCRGNYSPPDLSTPSDAAYWEANHQVSQMLDCLKSQLSKLVEQLVDKIYSAQCFEVESYFKLGFASGMVLEREVQEELQQTMQSP